MENGILLSVQNGIDITPDEFKGEYSDGYHTFNELYEFRKLYNAALFNWWVNKPEFIHGKPHINRFNVHKSLRHFNGDLCFGGGWFIVSAMLPTGQISNHYKVEDWDLFQVPETFKAQFEFDNHTSQDVLERLTNLCKIN